jgi:protein involved in polysaccharide export with SLBB domain
VDFVGLFEQRQATKDVFLKDGDVVFIPHSQKTVYVYGQVTRPGYVSYKEGADVRYYLDQAGGYGEEAETGGTRVIKGKTREWLDPSDTAIEAGDYIWVPKDIRYPTGYYLNLVSQAASFISVVLSMTVIILQLTK